jgi:hypothetical protein
VNSYNGCYAVSWNGIAGATVYNLYQSTNGGGWVNVQANASGSWSVCGKPNGAYGYYVQACNAGGCSAISNVATVTVLYPPAAPTFTGPGTHISLNKTSAKTFTVSWTATPTATSYPFTSSYSVSSSQTSATSMLEHANTSGEYRYTVQACNAAGCSATVFLEVEVTIIGTIPP